jgi:ATP-dependent DNA helicase RecG
MKTREAEIDQLRLLPEADLVSFLVETREDQWLERSSARVAARQVADLMVGFANAEGGLLVVGVHNGKVEGVADPASRVNDWRQAALDFTEPPVRHKFESVPCANSKGEHDEIVVIEIEPSERVHTNRKHETFLRVGDENRRLGPLEAQELRYDKGESIYDGTPVEGMTMDHLDGALVSRYFKKVRAASSRDAVLRARGLATVKNETVRPSIAGLLVLGAVPQQALPQASVRLLRYRGSSRETGTRMNVAADRRLEGPLPKQIDSARKILKRWIPSAIRLQRDRFVRATLIPDYVWLEAIVNAVTHRSYSIAGDHVRVEVFEDRVEVESPGRLPGLVRLENIRSTRFARNPRVARALSDLGYGRELGEGVNRMFEEMNRAGLPDPVYQQGPASVRVTLLADPLAGRILDRLPSGSERFVEYLSRMGRVTTTQATELLAVTRPTVLKYLHDLAEHGLIEHVGTSLKDPRGFWRLTRAEVDATRQS